MVCLNFSEFYTSYQPKQFIRFDLAIIKLKLPFLIGHDSKEDKPNPICLDFTMNDSHEFGEDFWWMKTLTMVGFGSETTQSFADLNFANVQIKAIDECIKEMYGDKISNTDIYDKKNAICVHGKSYYLHFII